MNNQMIKVLVACQGVWRGWTDSEKRDEGSATETAIIVGTVAVAALALALIIQQVIEKYASQIK